MIYGFKRKTFFCTHTLSRHWSSISSGICGSSGAKHISDWILSLFNSGSSGEELSLIKMLIKIG